MSHVVLRGVGKRYPNSQRFAVRNINLELARGEFLTLVGPSGCGKSTTLRMIAGLEEITEGDLYIAGRRANDLPPKDRNIAMVFQSYALFPHMTVAANIVFGLKVKGVPPAERQRKLEWACELLDLKGLEHRRPAELSGGQRQRVALGRALVLEPEVLLLDEPLSNLDAKLRLRMRTELKNLHRKLGLTVIYVTHDQAEAMTLSDRIAVYDNGRIVQVGTPEEVYYDPVNRFVAGFIGAPPMNFFDGWLEGGAFVTGGVRVPLGHGLQPPREPAGAVTLGVRPEDLTPVYEETPGALPGRVAFIERLGSDDYLVVEVAGILAQARVPAGTRVESGRPVWLVPRPGRVYWFAGDEEGRRLR
ncbi:MAG: ABC transporter ATP-binding protein [Firmicutes bacterium]|nr:ABC transporter ATP-binding protein [Bacillota bacterium]